MPFPYFAVGPSVNFARWLRVRHQSRRRVRLTVHPASEVVGTDPATRQPIYGRDVWCVTVTNASRDRAVVVTHVWLDTTPRFDVLDPALPVRLRDGARWEALIPADEVSGPPELVPWLARCQLSPDDKIVKSRPRENVPPVGLVPRG